MQLQSNVTFANDKFIILMNYSLVIGELPILNVCF
jgi:hypothetical protein